MTATPISLEYPDEALSAPRLAAIREGQEFTATAYGASYAYRAQADAVVGADGRGFIRAVRANPVMRSGWECADVLFRLSVYL
jgi:hypothetical protein